ncbi:MAG: hypothetical protein ACK5ZX_00810 [Bacteroidota bacterium]|jgi:hypothetical protein
MRNLIDVVLMLLLVSSCETDFAIEANEKEIPVVYGVLNINEPKQYIRIQKAFLSKGSNVLDLSKDPNIIYYADGKAILTVLSTGKTILGKRMNAEDIGIKRDIGIFAESPNILYEFDTKDWIVTPPGKVIFTFENEFLPKTVSAQISMIKDLQLREGVPSVPLNLGYDRIITIGWNHSTDAKLFDLIMRIHYQEKSNKTNGILINKSVEWVLKNNLEVGSDPTKGTFSFKGVDFYKFLSNTLSVSSDIQRNMKSVDIFLSAGGTEFKEILDLNQANFGLTGSNNIPRYSNIVNGIGFLSSRMNVSRTDIPLSSATLDSLRLGVYTKTLQFK